MKRQILACFFMCVAGMVFASDATIDEVVTFQRGEKTSVVITYAGTERLRFFALDSTEGVFSLDLPGVFSHFDFTSLAFNQVTEVKQLALDPDISNGIRVSFFLKKGVTYDIFESGSKNLTLFFEGGIPDDAPRVATDTPPAEKIVKDETLPVSAPVNRVQTSLEGTRGEGKLYEVSVDAAAHGGKLFLSVDQPERFTHFFLDNPDRFVLDLRGTILALVGNDLALDHPLVNRVRIRQFQSHPEPITRLVLDLNAETHVNVVSHEPGLVVIFGQDTDAVAALMDELDAEGVAAVEEDAVMADEVPSSVTTEQAELSNAADAIASEAVVVPTEDAEPVLLVGKNDLLPVDDTLEEAPLAVDESDATAGDEASDVALVAGAKDQGSDPEGVQMDTALQSESVSSQVLLTEDDTVVLDEPEPLLENQAPAESEKIEVADNEASLAPMDTEMDGEDTASSPVADHPSDIGLNPEEEPVSSLAPQQTASVLEERHSQEVAEDSSSINREMDDFQAEVEPETAVSDNGPATVSLVQDEALADEPLVTVPDAGGDEITQIEVEPVAEAREMQDQTEAELNKSVAPGMVVLKPAAALEEAHSDMASPVAGRDGDEPNFNEPTRGIEDPLLMDQTESTSFVMASDIDLEMEAFIKEGNRKKTLYDQMKGIKSTRRQLNQVRVTNNLIAKKKMLVESSNMQDEAAETEDFGELFREDEDSIQSLGDEQPKYRGFDIMIDIREQPVLDLLRFLADEVGFNLYVDNSVNNIKATYKFRNIPWDQALDIILTNANLDKEFRNGVLRVATTEKFRDEERARAELRLTRELSVPTETVTVDLNYARARDIVPIVSEYLSPRGSIIRDDRTNILIIRDIPKFMVDIRTLINRLDKRIPQVSIEARIVETTTRFLRELGIQWGLAAAYSPSNGTETGVDFPHRVALGGPRIGQPRSVAGPEGGYAVNLPIVSENPSGLGLTLGNFLDNFKLDISMQLLESEGQGQVISSPKITTQNNRTAVITNGQRIPIQTIQRGTVTTQFIDAVLELQVTPQITADETIIMDLVVDKSEPDFSRSSGAGGNPVINTSRAETQVLVKNGGTAVIGGIFSLNEQLSESGIPKLRKIPVLRRLFSSQNKQYTNQELLIFVTPKIVKY